VQELFSNTFKVLNGTPLYIAIEQNDYDEYQDVNFKEKIHYLVEYGQTCRLEKISVLLNKASRDFNSLSIVLLNNGFEHYSSIVEVTKELKGMEDYSSGIEWKFLDENECSEHYFMKIWEQCMLFSDNEPSTLSMEQHINSVKSELGDSWRNSCRVFLKEGRPIGITIPHIEPGTTNEGRLFYFGLIPEERGKAQGSILHSQSLGFLREMGATYYIGSTHLANVKMQKVFKKNECIVKSHKESYNKYF
jgi:hypothetical protein